MLNIAKILKASGIDVKELMEESKKVPALLEILAEQSNKQTGAIKELAAQISDLKESQDTKLTELRENVDRILEKENE
ncbi:hypothetical protein ES702_01920 [subsurface metagenome]